MKLPKSQLSKGLTSGSELIIIKLVIALAKAPTAIPDKINVFELIEREEKEIITVIPTAITPPKKEANGKIEICIRIMGPISIKTIVAPKADPEAAPIRYGSARGFLNIA